MDEEESDQRLTHKLEPNQPVPKEKLLALGVLSWEGLTGPGISLHYNYDQVDRVLKALLAIFWNVRGPSVGHDSSGTRLHLQR
jgi:hypothetical protein